MRNPFNLPAVVVAAACLGCAGGARADFIVNGGFETGDFTGWTVTGDAATYGVDGSNPHSGNFNAFFGQPANDGAGKTLLMQAVTTTPGLSYVLDFYLMSEDPGISNPSEFSVQFGSTVLTDQVDHPPFTYHEFQYTVVATANVTILTFAFSNDNAFFDLDDVSLRAVPEPSSLACLAIGVVVLGWYRWRKRSVRVAA